MQTSAGTPKCCLPREHLGLRCESKFAEELRTSAAESRAGDEGGKMFLTLV